MMDTMMIEQGTHCADQLISDVLFGTRFDPPPEYQYYGSPALMYGYRSRSIPMSAMSQMANAVVSDGAMDFDTNYSYIGGIPSPSGGMSQPTIEMEYTQSLQQLSTDLAQLELIQHQRFLPLETRCVYTREDDSIHKSYQLNGFSNESNRYWTQDTPDHQAITSPQEFNKSAGDELAIMTLNPHTNRTKFRCAAVAPAAECDKEPLISSSTVPRFPNQEKQGNIPHEIETSRTFDNQSTYDYPFDEENGLSGVSFVYNQDAVSESNAIQGHNFQQDIPDISSSQYETYIPSTQSHMLNMGELSSDIPVVTRISHASYQNALPKPASPQFLISPSPSESIDEQDTKVKSDTQQASSVLSPPEVESESWSKRNISPVSVSQKSSGSSALSVRVSLAQTKQRRKGAGYSRLSQLKMCRSHKQNKSSAQNPKINLEFENSSNGLPLVCPHPGCSKIFPKLYNLKSHLVCHSTDRPHECSLCGKSFARKHDLQRHLRTIHSANRPFECDLCFESFPRADALRRHKIFERNAARSTERRRHGGGVCHNKKVTSDCAAQRLRLNT